MNKDKKDMSYNYYTNKEKDNYREMHDNIDFTKKFEVERQYNLSQGIILTIIWLVLIVLTLSNVFFELFGLLLYFHGFFLLLMFSLVCLIYSYKKIKESKWFLFPLLLAIIQIILSLSNMFI